jgi:hypothetical protein
LIPQKNIELTSTIEFLSKNCKSNNHINCCRIWTGIGIGFQVICTCSCHNNDSDDSDTIHIRSYPNE